MLDKREQSFVDYWSVHRDKEAGLGYQLLTGLPIGLLFALPVIFILFSGRYWYKRADMVANSELSLTVLVIAVLAIAVFVAFIYKRHQWDMKEQQYLELKGKAKKNS
jgi:membrane protein YdbS with pleckstrin-like domain